MRRRRPNRGRLGSPTLGAHGHDDTQRERRGPPPPRIIRERLAGQADRRTSDPQHLPPFKNHRQVAEPATIASRPHSPPKTTSLIAGPSISTRAPARSSGHRKHTLSLSRVSRTTSLGVKDRLPIVFDKGAVVGYSISSTLAAKASGNLDSPDPPTTEGRAALSTSHRRVSDLNLPRQLPAASPLRGNPAGGQSARLESRKKSDVLQDDVTREAVDGRVPLEPLRNPLRQLPAAFSTQGKPVDGQSARLGPSLPRFELSELPPTSGAALAARVIVTEPTHRAAHSKSLRKAVQAALDGSRTSEELLSVDGSPVLRSRPRDDDPQGLHDANPNPAQQEHDEERVTTALAEASRESYPRLHRETCGRCRRAQRRLRAARTGLREAAGQWRRLDELTAEADRRVRRRRARQQSQTSGKAERPRVEAREFTGSRAEHAALAKLAAEQEVTDDVTELSKACYAYALWLRLQHGWRAGWGSRPPPARQIFNYASVDEPRHRAGTDASFCKLADAGAFGDPGFINFLAEAPSSVTPYLAVTKAADRARSEETGSVLKVRLCLDCSVNFNDYVDRDGKQRFFYAGYEAVSEKIQAGDFVACGDLMSYYTQIALHPSMSKYLMSEVPQVSAATRKKYGIPAPSHWDEASGRYRGPFVAWERLPFGVSRGCAIASMLTSEIVRIAEARGLRVASYIDDFLVMSTSAEGCAQDFEVLESILDELGLRLQNAKSQQPAQSGNAYLGIEIDTVRQEYRIGAERQRRMAQEIRGVLAATHLEKGRMKSLLGRLSWLSQVQRAGRARVRPLYGSIHGLASRERVRLSDQDREDLAWFLVALDDPEWVGSRWMKPRVATQHIVKSDAGDDAIGFLYRGRYAYYQLTPEERQSSSHARELLAAALALELFGPEAAGETLYFVTDNSGTAVTISSLGTSDTAGQMHCRRLGDASVLHDVDVAGIWQPREFNVVCDALSKLKAPPTTPCWVPFSAKEISASRLANGTGCLLLPRAYCPVTRCHLGYAQVSGRC